MRLLFGGFPIGDASWDKFTWGRELLRNKAGIGYGFTHRCAASEIGFAVSDQADCSAKILAVESVLAQQDRDLVFQQDNGLASANSILNGATFSGVRCVSGPVWSDKPGAQFATWREYAAEWEWETHLAVIGSSFLIEYRETYTYTGGDPLIILLEPLNARPVAQVTVPEQGYRAVQEGSAIGLLARPAPQPPLFPAALTRRQITNIGGDRVGVNRRNFGVKWRYEYASATPLAGVPNEWIG